MSHKTKVIISCITVFCLCFCFFMVKPLEAKALAIPTWVIMTLLSLVLSGSISYAVNNPIDGELFLENLRNVPSDAWTNIQYAFEEYETYLGYYDNAPPGSQFSMATGHLISDNIIQRLINEGVINANNEIVGNPSFTADEIEFANDFLDNYTNVQGGFNYTDITPTANAINFTEENYIGTSFFGGVQDRYLNCNFWYDYYSVPMCTLTAPDTVIDTVCCVLRITDWRSTEYGYGKYAYLNITPLIICEADSDFYNAIVESSEVVQSSGAVMERLNALTENDGYMSRANYTARYRTASSYYGGGMPHNVNTLYQDGVYVKLHFYYAGYSSPEIGEATMLSNMYLYPATFSTPLSTDVVNTYDPTIVSSILEAWRQLQAEDESGTVSDVISVPGTDIQDADDMLAIVVGLEQLLAQTGENNAALTNYLVQAQQQAIEAQQAEAAEQVGNLDITFEDLRLSNVVATRFPFCIPFDLYNAFAQFDNLPREAPVWTIPLTVRDNTVNIVMDCTQFEDWAVIIRWSLLVSFNVGLILVTRKLIKG